MKWRAKIVPLLGALLLFLACGGAEQVEKEKIDLREVERVLQVKFPAGSEAVGMMKSEERDRLIRLKVTMPAEALTEFLESAPIARDDFSERRRFFLGPDTGWWDPSKPAALPTGQAKLENGSVVNMGIDRSNASRATVYLLWHET